MIFFSEYLKFAPRLCKMPIQIAQIVNWMFNGPWKVKALSAFISGGHPPKSWLYILHTKALTGSYLRYATPQVQGRPVDYVLQLHDGDYQLYNSYQIRYLIFHRVSSDRKTVDYSWTKNPSYTVSPARDWTHIIPVAKLHVWSAFRVQDVPGL